MKFRSYKKLLAFLFEQLPMYQRVGKAAFKKDLGNVKKLLEHIDNPQDKFRSVHIAGTNGKGSVTHLIASVLVGQGMKVGIYTSPHYLDFRERIKIGKDFIAEREVLAFVNDHYEAILKIKPSFFEITVAMAFSHFAKHKVDIAIIETGLGGRLDSTNVIKPLLSVITNISLDHQAMLGNTLTKIAKEKAGIIKSKIPVVIGEYQRSVAEVFKKTAAKKSARLYFANRKASAAFLKNNPSSEPLYKLKNQVTAYVALEVLKEVLPTIKLNQVQIVKRFKNVHKSVYYIGRWQKLRSAPKVFLDSAHNVAGIKIVLEHLKSLKFSKLHIVVGFVNDKDHSKVLDLLPRAAAYYFTKANIPRGLAAVKLKLLAENYALMGQSYGSVEMAYKSSLKSAKKSDLILVMGSIFVVAEMHAFLNTDR